MVIVDFIWEYGKWVGFFALLLVTATFDHCVEKPRGQKDQSFMVPTAPKDKIFLHVVTAKGECESTNWRAAMATLVHGLDKQWLATGRLSFSQVSEAHRMGTTIDYLGIY